MGGRFEGKVALVTGGNSGMGQCTALAFALEGAKVVVAARRMPEGEETIRKIKEAGGEAIFIKTDIAKTDEIETLIRKTVEAYGRIDIAFNNAATASRQMSLLAEETEEDFDMQIRVNLTGVWLCMKYQILQMIKQGGGVIVVNSSVTGVRSSPVVTAAYATSKHAVVGVVKTAALEYASAGIRINAVCPGYIGTPMLLKGIKKRPELLDMIKRDVPMQRMGTDEEIAKAVLWLCSDAAAYVTGQSIVVDGGMLAK